jgi:REP element-mobilizing transposase RayT
VDSNSPLSVVFSIALARRWVDSNCAARVSTKSANSPLNVAFSIALVREVCYLLCTFYEGLMAKTIGGSSSVVGQNRAARRAERDRGRTPGERRGSLARGPTRAQRNVTPGPAKVREARRSTATRRHPRKPQQLSLLDQLPKGHGGRREGAGRPRSTKRGVPHGKRPFCPQRSPVHVTLHCRERLPSLREPCTFRALVDAIRAVRGLAGFRVVHYTLQSNHIHLIVETDSQACLAKGMRILATRMTRAFNRVHACLGSLWASRYHARILRSPREVRRAIVYVLGNWRHHGGQHEPRGTIDPCSSARWFRGFREALPPLPDGFVPPTSEAQSWLLRVGWTRHGLISVDEGPWLR